MFEFFFFNSLSLQGWKEVKDLEDNFSGGREGEVFWTEKSFKAIFLITKQKVTRSI